VSAPHPPCDIILEILRFEGEFMTVHDTNSTNFKVLDPLHDVMRVHGSQYMTVFSRNLANSRVFEGVYDLIIVNE
jgi:hypothetical protein